MMIPRHRYDSRRGGRRPAGVWLSLLLALLAGSPAGVLGQVASAGADSRAHIDPLLTTEGPFDRGLAAAALRIRGLEGIKRILVVGAHPDDEDTALITALARGMGAEVAYLSLTRGDGGQNLIGPGGGVGRGESRPGERVAARLLDGGRQYFTRAFDFGFSKTAEESFRHWPEDELVRDVVGVVRAERPHVIVSIFSGTPADGHGQHQAAGIAARQAFDAAADPSRYPAQLAAGAAPWQPLKLYQSRRFSPSGATLSIETGRFDPVIGRSHHQLAMESRSLHRSQDMGTGQPLGPRRTYLSLVRTAPELETVGGEADPARDRADRAGARASPPGDDGIFAGIDTTLARRARALPAGAREAVLEEVDGYRSAIDEARRGLSAFEPAGAVSGLRRALEHLDRALEAARGSGEGDEAGAPADGAAAFLADVAPLRSRVEGALLAAAGVTARAVADRETFVPGESLEVTIELWNGGSEPVTDMRPRLLLPSGWTASPVVADEDGRAGDAGSTAGARSAAAGADRGVFDPAHELPPGEVARWRCRVEVPAEAPPTRPYFMEEPRDGGLFRWPDDPSLHGLPWNPAPVRARIELAVGGSPTVGALRDVRYLEVDKALGEVSRPLRVVPAVSLRASPSSIAWPVADGDPRTLSVTVAAEAPVRGTLRAHAPNGWRIEPREQELRLESAGESRSIGFRVTPGDASAGEHAVRFEVLLDDGRRFDEGYTLIDYPHIEPNPFFAPAEVRITHLPVEVRAGLRVGYIQGSGDDGPEALRQMGVPVEVLDLERVRSGDFGDLTTLVLGIRVYETRPEIAGVNRQILDFARGGGTVIVQYNKHEYPAGDFAPYPVTMAPRASRVTNHESPVEFVDPDSPLFHTPNLITEADFEGWVQERGLYFLESWDAAFRPQLALQDPGEEPHMGSLLVAPVGEGLYVYTGLAFFRQLPAGVPGALRLFANLVSLDPGEWRERDAR